MAPKNAEQWTDVLPGVWTGRESSYMVDWSGSYMARLDPAHARSDPLSIWKHF